MHSCPRLCRNDYNLVEKISNYDGIWAIARVLSAFNQPLNETKEQKEAEQRSFGTFSHRKSILGQEYVAEQCSLRRLAKNKKQNKVRNKAAAATTATKQQNIADGLLQRLEKDLYSHL